MSNIKKFEELLRSDEALQAKLLAATEAFEGDKRDERALFDAVIAPLAAEAGLPFTYDEAREFVTEEFDLNENELAAVAGGTQNSLGKPEVDCLVFGMGFSVDACTSEHSGAGVCFAAGIGLMHF